MLVFLTGLAFPGLTFAQGDTEMTMSGIVEFMLTEESQNPDPDPDPDPDPTTVSLKGTNLAGAEFGPVPYPATFGTDYIYPNQSEVQYFMSKGMNTFRLPFTWERLQHTTGAAFDSAELARLTGFVDGATNSGAFVVLDPHNYSRYYGDVIGAAGSSVSANDFADFWSRLAGVFSDNERVIFGLMNEPHDMSTELWLANANAAIAAIRQTGAKNRILVPGNGYTGAWTWNATWYGSANAQVMQGIVDPENYYYIEVHQYFDADGSGRYSGDCVGAAAGAGRQSEFTSWLRANELKGFLGEFGIIDTANCRGAISGALQHIEDNIDVWAGWTYWAAGPWWGDYPLSIEPTDQGADRPIINQLTPFLP